MKTGIDISTWQTNIDWEKVKNNVDFAILRTGYGSPDPHQIDNQFTNHLRGCQSVGIPTGAYHMGYATTCEEAREEARFCLSILGNTEMPYGVWYDVETREMISQPRQALTDIINAFCDEIEKEGYISGLYMSLSYIQNNVYDEQLNCKKWVAQYNDVLQYEKYADIWQFTSSGEVDGIPGNVDIDRCYTDFEPAEDPYEWFWYGDHKKWAVKENGNWVYDKWIFDNNYDSWYRIDKDGWMLNCGWYKEGGYWYYLNDDGVMQIGWKFVKDEYGNAWYYFDKDGHLSQNKWVWDSNEQGWYFLKPSGQMATNEFCSAPGEYSRYWVDEHGKWVK